MKVSAGSAELEIRLQGKFYPAAGAIHGSVYSKALDAAACFAANSLAEEIFVLTAYFNPYLIRPVISGCLSAVGRGVSQNKQRLFAEAILHDEQRREVAQGSGSFKRSAMELTEEIGSC